MAAPTGLEDLRILIVDDNAQMRTIVGTALSGAGIRQVYYAPDGQKGLETLNRWTPDIVFVDFEMPIMNGLEFLRLVRSPESKQRTVPVIMLTARDDELDKVLGDKATSPLTGILRIIPIERMNALLVITPQPEYLEEAKRESRLTRRACRTCACRSLTAEEQDGPLSRID